MVSAEMGGECLGENEKWPLPVRGRPFCARSSHRPSKQTAASRPPPAHDVADSDLDKATPNAAYWGVNSSESSGGSRGRLLASVPASIYNELASATAAAILCRLAARMLILEKRRRVGLPTYRWPKQPGAHAILQSIDLPNSSPRPRPPHLISVRDADGLAGRGGESRFEARAGCPPT
jgi:hypothetical protein